MNDMLRITGLATGIDTDAMVKQMMKAQTIRLDKIKQQRQIVEWRQEIYRDIIGDINTFKSTYFDILKPETNMLSKNSYACFDVKSSESSIVNATASSGAMAGVYTVSFEGDDTQLAKSAIKESSMSLKVGDSPANLNTKLSDLGMTLDESKITINYNDGKDDKSFNITINKDQTISDLINKINAESKGNVKARFSELTGKLSIQTGKTGEKTSISLETDKIENETNALSALGLTTDSVNGQNAKVYITPPGGEKTLVERDSNNFTIDGINYDLVNIQNAEGKKTAYLTVTQDNENVFENIVGFIDKYNELVDKVTKLTEQKKQYSYLPLTEEQKKEMKEDEIKRWEEKAKEGLIRNDSNLDNMLRQMRSAFFQSVEDAGLTLKDLGLSTSPDTTQRGKIVFDPAGGEQKLKDAIANNGEQVALLFSKQSTSVPSYNPDLTRGERELRNQEQGIFQRINDILQDYTRTTRNVNGKKGLLLEKAGIKGDFTEYNNLLSKELKDKDKMIDELNRKLFEKENKYYLQFARLEQAMNSLNAQSNWLYMQLGMGNQ